MTARKAPSIAALAVCITPFNAEGSLDEPAFRAHLDRLAAAGLGVYVGGGGPGEGYTQSAEEGRRLLDLAVGQVGGRVEVRARGLEPRTPGEMIDYLRSAEAAGVDATVVSSLDAGHGYRLDLREVDRYFSTVLEAASSPVVLSVHPAVGYPIPPNLVQSLVGRFDCVVGIDCAMPEVAYLQQLLDLVGAEVEVRSGGPPLALANLALGGHGFVSAEANIAPRLCASVVARFTEGDLEGTCEAWRRLMRLSAVLSRHRSGPAAKAALSALGLPGGTQRPPRLPVVPEAERELERVLGELQIRETETP